MNPNRTLPFQVPYRHGNAVPRRHAQQHMNVVWKQMPLDQLDVLLPTQLPKNLSDFSPQPSIKHFSPVLW
jgi:hypothetical protein